MHRKEGERGIKRLITVFAEVMSHVASRASRAYRGELCDTKVDGKGIAMIHRIKLEHLVELMESENYRDRFVAEYIQLKQRYEKLKAFNTKIEAAVRTSGLDNGVDEPIHDCPAGLLREQQAAMGEYLHLLEVRAVIEDIDLEDAIRYYIYKALQAEREYHGFTACECEPREEKNTSSTASGSPSPAGEGLCCQKGGVPPWEEEINNPPVELPEGIIPFGKLMSMLAAAVECEESAGDKPCEKERCPVWNGEKCLWGEAELYESSLYYLKKLLLKEICRA